MRSRFALIVALLAVLIGSYGLYQQSTNNSENTEGNQAQVEQVRENDTPQYVQAWRAKTNIDRGNPISLEIVERVQMPVNIALEEGISSDVKLDFSESTLLRKNVKSGQIILPEYQVPESHPEYIDLLISEGKEPYSLSVSSKNLVQGYIRPGTYVDVLSVTSPLENLSEDSKNSIDFSGVKASLIMQNVKVLSVSSEQEGQNVSAKSSADKEHFVTVVLEIDPRDIARISIAQKTTHLEIYRSHDHKTPIFAEVRDVIENYSGVMELRGADRQSKQGEEL